MQTNFSGSEVLKSMMLRTIRELPGLLQKDRSAEQQANPDKSKFMCMICFIWLAIKSCMAGDILGRPSVLSSGPCSQVDTGSFLNHDA